MVGADDVDLSASRLLSGFFKTAGGPRCSVSFMSTDSNAGSIRSRHVSQVIKCPVAQVYDFAANPENLPRWAAGLSRGAVERVGDTLLVDSPMGRVIVRFTARNDLGVLDHDVTLPSGETVNNPVRVLAHPDGAEVLFTIRQIDLSDDEFDRDTRMVAEDLERLRAFLEP